MRKAFHEELDELCQRVVELGELAIDAVGKGTQAFVDGDVSAAETVVTGDRKLDELMVSIEMHACELLARQQPMAGDLRTLVTVLRAIHELERCGDYMVNIAKATRRLYPAKLSPEVMALVKKMCSQATNQLQAAVSAFSERDVSRAAALSDMDDVMDDLQKDLLRWIFSAGSHEDETIRQSVQIALVGRYFERVADHAVNVGERVKFMVDGFLPNE